VILTELYLKSSRSKISMSCRSKWKASSDLKISFLFFFHFLHVCHRGSLVKRWRFTILFPIRISAGIPTILTEISGAFRQSFHASAKVAPRIKPWLLRSTSFPVHCSLIIWRNIVWVTDSVVK
jgi:hypothetical protein